MATLADVNKYGLIADRPAAGNEGFTYFASDEGINYRDNGATWDAISADISGVLLASNNLDDVTSVSTARTSLGLGTAAVAAASAFAAVASNLSDLTNAGTARTNLGLDTAATHPATDFAAASHTHTASNVTDFSEAVDDRVSALLTEGTNVSLTYNDSGGTLTIDVASGGDMVGANNLSDLTDPSDARDNLELGTAATHDDGDYADAVHTHPASDVTNFSEAVDDRVAALLVQGSNVTLTYDDGANTLTIDSTGGGGGGGTVSSVALTVPSWLSVSGSPITTSGTLAVSATTGQTANRVLATPDGTTGAVGLRALVAADLPTLPTESARGDVAVTTGSLANNAVGTGTIALGKSALVLKVTTDHAAWVRLYSTSAARTADASRLVTADPTPGTGVMLDVVTTGGALAITLSPPIGVSNDDGTPATDLYYSITNQSGSTLTITATISRVVLEI